MGIEQTLSSFVVDYTIIAIGLTLYIVITIIQIINNFLCKLLGKVFNSPRKKEQRLQPKPLMDASKVKSSQGVRPLFHRSSQTNKAIRHPVNYPRVKRKRIKSGYIDLT